MLVIIVFGACFAGVVIIGQSLWALVTGTPVTLMFYSDSSEHTWYAGLGYGILHILAGALIYGYQVWEDSQNKKS